MSDWKGLLLESPVSRVRKLSESPTLEIKGKILFNCFLVLKILI